MRSKNNKGNSKQSIRLLDNADVAEEVIRLTPEAPSLRDDQAPRRKINVENSSEVENINSKPTALFESNVLVDKLENHKDNRDLGRGFRSKDLNIEDLGKREDNPIGIEEKWSQGNQTLDRWITKMVILGGVLILFAGGWAFFNLKFSGEVKLDSPAVLPTSEDNAESDLNRAIIQKTITGFLEATTIEERLKWSRKPEEVLGKMKRHYVNDREFKFYKSSTIKKILKTKLSGEDILIVTNDAIRADEFQNDKEESVFTALVNDGNGNYLVDWPSFASYQPSDFKSFMSSMSTTPSTFRLVIGSRVDKGPYLYSFSDDQEYQAYIINFTEDDENYLYAYVKVGSEQESKLKQLFSNKALKIKSKSILTIAYPENSETPQCVEILDMVSSHWFLP